MKKLNILLIFAVIIFFACNENTSTNSNKVKNNDSNKKETVEEEQSYAPGDYKDYKGAEVAFVKEGKLYFYYPQKNEIKQLEEETEKVFNCHFAYDSEILYYTVIRDSILWLKEADYSGDKPLEIREVCNFGINIKDCFSEVCQEKTKLLSISDEVILEYEYEYEYEYENFIPEKKIAYSLTDKKAPYEVAFDGEMHIIDAIEEKNNNLFYNGNNLSKNLSLDSLNISSEVPISFSECRLSKDSSKLIFEVKREDYDTWSYHPCCISDTDGKNQQILNFSMYFNTKPIFIRNRVVFLRETSSTEDSRIILAITNAKDNSISEIDEYVDYYAVRELTQTENAGETNNAVLGKGEIYAYFSDPDEENPTNLRKTPGGEIIYKIPVNQRDVLVFSLVECKNKWFKIKGNLESCVPERSPTITLNQECWVHSSVIAAGLIGSIDNPVIRKEPDMNAEVVAKIKMPYENVIHFLDMKGDWVKITCTDDNNIKQTGWILSEWICANPLTTCP